MIRPSLFTVSFLVRAAVLACAVTAGGSGCKRPAQDKPDKPAKDTPAAPATPAASGSAKPPGSTKVGLVFDVGGRGDKSFNDSAWRGSRARRA